MLIYVTDPAKWVLSRSLANDYKENIFSNKFIWIQLCGIFQKCPNCLFELQMSFSPRKTSYFSKFVESYFRG